MSPITAICNGFEAPEGSLRRTASASAVLRHANRTASDVSISSAKQMDIAYDQAMSDTSSIRRGSESTLDSVGSSASSATVHDWLNCAWSDGSSEQMELRSDSGSQSPSLLHPEEPWTLGHDAGSFPRVTGNIMADRLHAAAVLTIQDSTVNPHGGSLPVQKVLSVMERRWKWMLTALLQDRPFSWFLGQNRSLVVFRDRNNKERVRHVDATNWEAADAQHRAEHSGQRWEMKEALVHYLYQCPDRSGTPDGFLAYFTSQPVKRGDLVRFVQRHENLFSYDRTNYVIRLLYVPHNMRASLHRLYNC